MSLSKKYVELYSEYQSEIDEIKKSLKMFKIKKNNALKEGIFAPEEEVARLESHITGVPFDESKFEKKAKSVNLEEERKEIEEDEELTEIFDILENDEVTLLDKARENDMVQIYRFTNGDMYIGRLLDGKMTGTASYIFNDEENSSDITTEYIGNFINGVREGKGVFIFSNGNRYTGNFKNNKNNGVGQMKYANGDEYIGQWVDGKKEGDGIYTWNDGYMYMGHFRDGKMDGSGSCFNSKGELVYDGEWLLGEIHGKGRYLWNKNKWYEGEFKQGEKHGEGVFYLNGQPVYTGPWKHDKPNIAGNSLDDIVRIINDFEEEYSSDEEDSNNIKTEQENDEE